MDDLQRQIRELRQDVVRNRDEFLRHILEAQTGLLARVIALEGRSTTPMQFKSVNDPRAIFITANSEAPDAGQPAREKQEKLVKEGAGAQRKCWHERCGSMVSIHKLWCSPCSAWVNDATAARPPECPCAERPSIPAQPSQEDDQKALRAAALEEARRCVLTYRDEIAWMQRAPTSSYALLVLEDRIRALAGSPAGEGREDNQEQLGKKGGES